MNQTRILLGVILLLVAAFGYLQWDQKNQFNQQKEEQRKLLEALVAGKGGTANPANPAATTNPSANPDGTAGPGAGDSATAATPARSPEEERMALLQAELEKMRGENETLRLQGQSTSEERDRLAGELEAAKFQIDQRMTQIRSAPMLGKVSRVVPEHGLVVISAGRTAGVEPKDEFSIRRGGKIICQIRIADSVDDAEAVADPIRGTMAPNESIQEGDEVVKLD